MAPQETNQTDFSNEIVSYRGFMLNAGIVHFADRIENFKVRDDDVWVCGFPKSGTTWTQEMIWCINNDLDYELAKELCIRRCPYFELIPSHQLLRAKGLKIVEFDTETMDYLDQMPSPRHLKTLLPFHLLPLALREKTTKAKIVHVTREPKDVCISYYHFSVNRYGYSGSFEEFVQCFLDDKLIFTPFWEHVISFHNQKDFYGDQMLSLKYEDMIIDLASIVRRAVEFLGKPQLSAEEESTLLEHLSFESMKVNSAVNRIDTFCTLDGKTVFKPKGDFIRKGKSDQWKAIMSPEMIQKFDERTSRTFRFSPTDHL